MNIPTTANAARRQAAVPFSSALLLIVALGLLSSGAETRADGPRRIAPDTRNAELFHAPTSARDRAWERQSREPDDPIVSPLMCQPEWQEGFGVPGIAGRVHALCVHDDGTGPALYVGGSFGAAGGVAANNIAKWDGNEWTPLGEGLSNGVAGLVLTLVSAHEGDTPVLYVGGYFPNAGGQPSSRIARWKDQTWQSLGPPLSDGVTSYNSLAHVRAMTVFQGLLYVAGYFHTAGGIPASCIARWDGHAWYSVGSTGLDGRVYALSVHEDGDQHMLIAGGDFGFADGVLTRRIAAFDGSSWSAIGIANGAPGNGMNGRVQALASVSSAEGSRLIATGEFTSVNNVPIKDFAVWDGAEWQRHEGASAFQGRPTVLRGVGQPGSQLLYVGGLNGAPARWTGSTWEQLRAPDGYGPSGAVETLIDGYPNAFGIVVGGSFFINTPARRIGGVALWNGNDWEGIDTNEPRMGTHSVATSMIGKSDGPLRGLYLGGSILQSSSHVSGTVARLEDGRWISLGPGTAGSSNGYVRKLLFFPRAESEVLIAAGDFTLIGGTGARNIAQWDGHSWSQLSGISEQGTSHGIWSTVLFNDGTGPALYVGGDFTSAGGVPAGRIARWDGLAWSAVGPTGDVGFNGRVSALCVHDDGTGPALYAGGSFSAFADLEVRSIAKWNGSDWSPVGSDLAYGTNGGVLTLQSWDDGPTGWLVVGGSFSQAGDVAASNIARWNGHTWHTFGAGVSGGQFVHVADVLPHDDGTGQSLVVAGRFELGGEVPSRGVVKWQNAQWVSMGGGVQTHSFEQNVPDGLCSHVEEGGNVLYAYGSFNTAAGLASVGIAKWSCSPNAQPAPCPADFNGDGTRDLLDLISFIGEWGAQLGQAVPHGSPADLDGNGVIDLVDLIDFLSAWLPAIGIDCP